MSADDMLPVMRLNHYVRARRGDMPAGMVMLFAIVPGADYLPCDGRVVSVHAYPDLYEVIGHTYSRHRMKKLPWWRAAWHWWVGGWPMELDEEPDTFRLPDMRGRVLGDLAE